MAVSIVWDNSEWSGYEFSVGLYLGLNQIFVFIKKKLLAPNYEFRWTSDHCLLLLHFYYIGKWRCLWFLSIYLNGGGVMVSVLASSVVDCRFVSRSGETKDYKVNICCFSTEHSGWLWIRIMCCRGETCLPLDCCSSSLLLMNKNKQT